MTQNTRVYLLDLGSMALNGHMFNWMHGPAGEIRFPVYGVLIDHKDGRFVYDTGFDKALVDQFLPGNAQQSEQQTFPGQLALAGFCPQDISHVINSHYHLDHVGGNKFCTHATTVCHQCELETAANPEPFEELGYSDLSFAPGLRAAASAGEYANDIYTPRFEQLTGDQEIAKGVHLFETPGHTPGHYSLMVELAGRRPMLFTGDACYTAHNLDANIIPTSHADVRQSFAALGRLRDLSQHYDAEIFASHDPQTWPNWTRAPGYYS